MQPTRLSRRPAPEARADRPRWRLATLIEIGLTGGIGSGKSTVAAMLADRGAVVLDSDSLVRELQAPGTAVFEAIVAQWGERVVADDGTLNRGELASIVFDDPAELELLNGIVHPAHAIEMERRRSVYEGTDTVLVFDIPLLVEVGRGGFDGVVVVDLDAETAIQRLVADRGLDEADARRRMANQASRAERLDRADFVLDNGGTKADLAAEVDRCWEWIGSLGEG
ncbi:MAG: Dephospho-CoA kinase [Acidimicrobiaceae bacterium]|nr:Dephospho-CoA kinase [Acidimicrobiaceae bacterium]